MHRYIARRLLYSIPVLLLVVVFVFMVLRLLPGDPIDATMEDAIHVTPQQMEMLKAQMGLDAPLGEQFGIWVASAARLDFGNSLINPSETVVSRIGAALPVTLELMVLTLLIGLLIGLPMGIWSAIRQNTAMHYGARVFAVMGLAIPDFFLATLLVMLPAIWFAWAASPITVSFFENPVGNLQQFIGPALVLGYSMAAPIARMTRSSMLEVLRSDYIKTAYSKGLRERSVIMRHAVKNAMIPVFTIFGTRVGFLVSGSVVVESVFGLPGLGRLTWQSITSFDYPQVQANVLFVAVAVIVINLAVDVMYGWFDPRIRYQ